MCNGSTAAGQSEPPHEVRAERAAADGDEREQRGTGETDGERARCDAARAGAAAFDCGNTGGGQHAGRERHFKGVAARSAQPAEGRQVIGEVGKPKIVAGAECERGNEQADPKADACAACGRTDRRQNQRGEADVVAGLGERAQVPRTLGVRRERGLPEQIGEKQPKRQRRERQRKARVVFVAQAGAHACERELESGHERDRGHRDAERDGARSA